MGKPRGWGAQQEARYKDYKKGKLSPREQRELERSYTRDYGRQWGERLRSEARAARTGDPRHFTKRWGHEIRDEARLRTIDTWHQGLFGKLFGGW